MSGGTGDSRRMTGPRRNGTRLCLCESLGSSLRNANGALILGFFEWTGEALDFPMRDHRGVREVSPRSSGFIDGGRSDTVDLWRAWSKMGSSALKIGRGCGSGVAGSSTSGRGCSLHTPARVVAVYPVSS